MSELLAFAELGFRHIVDVRALDHVLFLLVLAAVYRRSDWREALWVVSAFTVGHSVTLALAVTDALRVNEGLVEFLIPVTIVATAAENVAVRDRARGPRTRRYRPLFAGIFGLVHGAGFAGYLKSLFMTDIALPLLGFNIGIEVGQIFALALIAVALAGVDAVLRRLPRSATAMPPLRLRIVGLSLLVGVVATGWAVERRPW